MKIKNKRNKKYYIGAAIIDIPILFLMGYFNLFTWKYIMLVVILDLLYDNLWMWKYGDMENEKNKNS